MCGNLGVNQCIKAAFVVFPTRNQTIRGAFGVRAARSAKSSSFVIITEAELKRVVPNLQIFGLVQPQLLNVLSFVAFVLKPSSWPRRQLCVNQELHDGGTTTA